MAKRPRREDVRADLLRAATLVFERDGYAKSSLERIASEVGYTKGAVYSSFGSKPELFAEVCRGRLAQTSQAVMSRLETALAAQVSRRVLLEEIAAALASTIFDEPARWQLLLNEFRIVALGDPAVDAVYQEFSARRVAALVEMFCRNDYLLRLGPSVLEHAAVILLSLVTSLAVEHVLAPQLIDRTAVQLSIAGLLDAVLPQVDGLPAQPRTV